MSYPAETQAVGIFSALSLSSLPRLEGVGEKLRLVEEQGMRMRDSSLNPRESITEANSNFKYVYLFAYNQ